MPPQLFAQTCNPVRGVGGHRYNEAIATYKNTCLIYNPAAGKLQKHPERLRRAADVLNSLGYNVRMRPTTGPNTAGAIARECVAGGADLIVVAGGDGTINETVNGMIGAMTPLAVLPGGTANVLAVEIGLGRRMDAAARRLSACVPRRIAAGLIHTPQGARHFLLMAGAGLDAHIVYNLNLGIKRALGKLAYWIAGFSMVGRELREFNIGVNQHRARCSFALVSRVRNYGGDLAIACNACLLTNDFETVIFEGSSSLRYVKYFMGVLLRRPGRVRGVTVVRTRAAEFDGASAESPVYVQVDGEYAGKLPARVELVEDALTLLIPPDYGKHRF
jgi:diacylglycerol kinase family enzyme